MSLAAEIGVGVGNAVNKSGIIPESYGLVSKGASSGVGLLEKFAVANVIFICIILLVVGVSLLLNGNWKSGFVVTALGAGCIGGAVLWLKSSTTQPVAPQFVAPQFIAPQVDGKGEDRIGEDFEEYTKDIDLDLEPEKKPGEKKVRFNI